MRLCFSPTVPDMPGFPSGWRLTANGAADGRYQGGGDGRYTHNMSCFTAEEVGGRVGRLGGRERVAVGTLSMEGSRVDC